MQRLLVVEWDRGWKSVCPGEAVGDLPGREGSAEGRVLLPGQWPVRGRGSLEDGDWK